MLSRSFASKKGAEKNRDFVKDLTEGLIFSNEAINVNKNAILPPLLDGLVTMSLSPSELDLHTQNYSSRKSRDAF